MTTNPITQEKIIFGHPAGLYILFFVEMWERFSYYGMRAILTLFLAAPVIMGDPQSGYGWTNAETLSFYGTYTMCVYLMSIPGGWVADKFIGQKKAVMLGGLLLCAGHGILAVDAEWAFFTGLILIVVGVGFLKPNISTMVGGLYQKGDNKRDTGFYIFYMGINIGAFLGALTVGAVAAKYGWHYGFGLAGIGMAIGQLVYFYGLQYLEGVGEFIGSDKSPDKELMNKPLTKVEIQSIGKQARKVPTSKNPPRTYKKNVMDVSLLWNDHIEAHPAKMAQFYRPSKSKSPISKISDCFGNFYQNFMTHREP